MSEFYVPLQTRVREAILAVLQDDLIDRLATMGHTFLTDLAFLPVPPGAISGDQIAIGYLGAIRGNSDKDGLRLTRDTRDALLGYVLEIWCFGASDDEAQTRAEACECAITELLDLPEHRYLGGLIDSPITIGNTQAISAEDDDRTSLCWHLALPVSCRVRTNRPEHSDE
jgi:hypothetical protein